MDMESFVEARVMVWKQIFRNVDDTRLAIHPPQFSEHSISESPTFPDVVNEDYIRSAFHRSSLARDIELRMLVPWGKTNRWTPFGSIRTGDHDPGESGGYATVDLTSEANNRLQTRFTGSSVL